MLLSRHHCHRLIWENSIRLNTETHRAPFPGQGGCFLLLLLRPTVLCLLDNGWGTSHTLFLKQSWPPGRRRSSAVPSRAMPLLQSTLLILLPCASGAMLKLLFMTSAKTASGSTTFHTAQRWSLFASTVLTRTWANVELQLTSVRNYRDPSMSELGDVPYF